MQEEQQEQELLDVYTKSTILQTAKVAGIAAMLSIAGTALGIIAYFRKPSVTLSPAGQQEGFSDEAIQMAADVAPVQVFVSAIIGIILFYALYTFSKFTRKGIATNDIQSLDKGLFNLAGYFKIMAIVFVVILILSFLAPVLMGIGTAL